MIPGTCDIHVHASQAPFQGIGQNIENGQWNTWFERYAFPDESRFNDPAYAELTYTRFAKSLLATPTTRLCAYATTSRTATETLMKALAKFGFAGYVGKVNMDRNCAAGLLETTEETIAQTRLWLEETKFPSPKTGGMYGPDCVGRIHKKLLEKAGIEEHVRFHDLRHTFSTLAIQSGIDPKTVAEILGHASAEFSLDVYTHVTAGMKKEAAQKISGFMASVG